MTQIDILIPNYNKADFLGRTLDSLRRQRFTNWRAVVLDSFSTDGSWELLQREVGKDARFKLLQLPRPGVTGLILYRAWNTLLHHIEASLFAVLTSDDLWPENWLELMVGALSESPEAVASVSRVRLIDLQDQPGELTDSCRNFEKSFAQGLPMGAIPGAECALRGLLMGPIFSSIHSLVLRTDLLRRGLLFSEDLGFSADHEFYLQLGLYGPVRYLADTEALFRRYPEQASSAVNTVLVGELFAKTTRRNVKAVTAHFPPQAEAIRAAAEVVARRNEFVGWAPGGSLRHQTFLAVRRLIRATWHVPDQLLPNLQDRLAKRHFTDDFGLAAVGRISLL